MTVPAASRHKVAVSRMLYSMLPPRRPPRGRARGAPGEGPRGAIGRTAAWAAAISADFDVWRQSPSRADQPSTRSRNRSPRAPKSANWSKLAHAGESSTMSPGRAAAVAAATAASRSPQSCRGTPRRAPAEGCQRSPMGAVLPDQVHRRAAGAHRLGQRRERLALALTAEDEVQPPAVTGQGGQRDERAGNVRGLGIVDVADAVALAHGLEPVRDTREAAQARDDRIAVDPARERDRGRGHRVLDVVRTRDAELGDRQQRARSSHHSSPARTDSAAPGPAPKHTRRAQPPRSSMPSPSGATATSSLPCRAKICSLAAR